MKKSKPAPPPFKITGLFTKQTFLRLYKATGKTEQEAVANFEFALKSGEIVFVRGSGLSEQINVYKFG